MTEQKLINYLKRYQFTFEGKQINYPTAHLDEYKEIVGDQMEKTEAAVDALIERYEYDTYGVK